MRLKVHAVVEDGPDVYCSDEQGESHRVDFLVDGSLPEGTTAQDLVDKTIEVESLTPYVEIANGCCIVPDEAKCRPAV